MRATSGWSPQPLTAISIHAVSCTTNSNLHLVFFDSLWRRNRMSFPSSMDSLQDSALPNKILVGVSLDVSSSMELLTWAVGFAVHPNDTVIALHVLVGKDDKKLSCGKIRMRRAKAFVISVVGEFAEICRTKEVKLEAKVVESSFAGKGLVVEAASLEATFLLVGSSRNLSQRTSFAITKYCFKHAPQGCLVIAIGKHGLPQQDSDSESVIYEDAHQSSSTLKRRDVHSVKAFSPLQKLFGSKANRDNSFDDICYPTEEKTSPRTVLDVTEEETSATEECFSSFHSEIDRPKTLNMWKKLSNIKLFLPIFRLVHDISGKKSYGCLSNEEHKRPSWRCFSYEEISRATNNFHPDNMAGKGGYAEVYRGNLQGGQIIAVKRLARRNTDEHKEREFLGELGILGHVCHPNTVKLIGCCIENGLHLIFDFSPNGSLASALHGKNSKLLEWPVRYKIAIGIARGLHYLHKCCRRRIIHRDIKASNVLLGADFEPQISDFGLAKWLPKQWTHHSIIPIEGTFGYLAPEYFMHGIVDEKTDVFAFGILLLEIVTGRRPIDTSSKQSLLLWANPLLQSGKFAKLVDPKLEGTFDMDEMQRVVLTASYCIRQSSIWRPPMNEVLQLLTEGNKSKVAQSWRMPEWKIDMIEDYTVDMDEMFPTSQQFEGLET